MSKNFAEIERDQLTDSQRNAIAEASNLWKRLGSGAQLDEFLSLIPALSSGRVMAMRLAKTDKPSGKNYNQIFGAWTGYRFPDMDANLIANILFFSDAVHKTLLDEIRASLTPGQRARLNSPTSARQRVNKFIKEQMGLERRKRPDDKAYKDARKKYGAEYDADVRKGVEAWVALHERRLRDADYVIKHRKGGVLTKKEYFAIVKCLHTDQHPTFAQRTEALQILNSKRLILMDEKVMSTAKWYPDFERKKRA